MEYCIQLHGLCKIMQENCNMKLSFFATAGVAVAKPGVACILIYGPTLIAFQT